MDITYYGHSCFFIQFSDYSLLTDPYGDIGLPNFDVAADYVFSSHNHFDHNAFYRVKNAQKVKDGGCFKIIKTFHDNKNGTLRGINDVLIFRGDGLNCVFLGDLGENCNNQLIEAVKNTDVLFIPVGGVYTIDAFSAAEYVKKIKPAIVIPMHYKLSGSTINIDKLETFTTLFNNVIYADKKFSVNEYLHKMIISDCSTIAVMKMKGR